MSTREWIVALEAAGVPCGPINDLQQAFQDPQVQARGLEVAIPHAASPSVAGRAPVTVLREWLGVE